MTRSQFKDWQLTVDSTKDAANIYVNGQFNQALTDIYTPYHRPTTQPNIVQVTNILASVWKQSSGKYPVLDALFGTNYLLSAPSLTQPKLTNLGYVPLGSTLYTTPIYYIGQGHFYSQNKIFNPMIGPQQRIAIIDDLLFWLAVSGASVAYSAYVANNSHLTMTMPFTTSYDPGKLSWSEQNDWHYDAAVTYDGAHYGVNEETGEIRNTDTGEHLPSSVIPDHIKAGAAGITIGFLASKLSEMDIKPDDDFEWYTFSDLVADELEGVGNGRGHTIEKHVMKSDEYLQTRLSEVFISSSYYDIVTALASINAAKFLYSVKFQHVTKKEEAYALTFIPVGKGYTRYGVMIKDMQYTTVVLLPSTSSKGYRVLTSYPTPTIGVTE